MEIQIRDHNIKLRDKEKEIEKHKKDYRDKKRELDQLLDHNKRLIADKKAALEEAKTNEIRKDKQTIVMDQIKLRLEKNVAQDKKIESDHAEIQNMKQYIQNLMDRYVETKNQKDKEIKTLKEEIDKIKNSKGQKSAKTPESAAPAKKPENSATEQADSGTCS